MQVLCLHPFPGIWWNWPIHFSVSGEPHCSTSILGALHSCRNRDFPPQTLGGDGKQKKNSHNKAGSSWGYWKVLSFLLNHLGQELKCRQCVGQGCFPCSYPHAVHALENDPFTIMHCCLATRAFPLSFPKWKHGSICFGDHFPWLSLLYSK